MNWNEIKRSFPKKVITSKTKFISAIKNNVKSIIPATIKSKITKNQCLYPAFIPEIEIHQNLDFLLLELPPRYMPMMPNGLGYVHNILKDTGIRFQTIDANIIIYHLYHTGRLLEGKNPPATNSGRMLIDPWDNTNTNDWHLPEIVEYFWPYLEKIINKIVEKRPKAVGISLNGNNRAIVKNFVKILRNNLPEIIVIVGGYDCVYHNVATHLFSDFDYMIINEAELTLAPLVTALADGMRPRDLPGIVSRYDSSDRTWEPTPLIDNLDTIDFPRYEWIDTALYQTYNLQHLIPITASRGCNWGKCRFCAECFEFRKRSPESVVDEIEFMANKGFIAFHFNESDVNGDPENLFNVCTEIIRRKIRVNMVGQLRISKYNTKEYFKHLAKSGFTHLRFGVDGWSDKTLRLLNKGYNMRLVCQNIRDCHAAGIFTAVNIVIGEPGETEEDVKEIIGNLIRCKDNIDSIESLNTLILAAGSEYYINSDKYKIRFRGDKSVIYKNHPYFIPVNLWYSDDPYIDQQVRENRLDRICRELHKNGVNIGAFASRIVDELKQTNL